jgi:UDP-N-acetyl-D-glucosamine dehydrogenase
VPPSQTQPSEAELSQTQPSETGPHETRWDEWLQARIESPNLKIGVLGLGYVGLPLVEAALASGLTVFGYDIDPQKIRQLKTGQSYLKHAASEWILPAVERGRFVPTSEAKVLSEADALVICVPTPLTEAREPDLSYVVQTAQQIADYLRPGQLVCLESTTYPTTTREVLLPELERSGLRPGLDFFVAYSPEREDPGNPRWTTRDIPKLVGGLEPKAQRLAIALYRRIVRTVVPVSTAEVAEAAKILENTFRAVNIALVNEMKVLCERMGIDVWEVIEAAETKPFGYQAFYPGPGLGGHCIPIDPFYLTWVARRFGMTTRFIELAGEVNTSMPQYVVSRITEALNHQKLSVKGSRIAVLGLAYKPNIDDARESPSTRIMQLLLERGAELSYNDPFIAVMPRSRNHELPAFESQRLTAEYLGSQDCVLIATHHGEYDVDFIVDNARLVVDTRNATRHVTRHRERIVKA